MHFDYEKKEDRSFYKIAVPFIKVLANAQFRLKIVGSENIPKEKGRLILACNHISFADPAVLISCFPYSIHFIAKSELFENPVIAFFLRSKSLFNFMAAVTV